MRINPIIWTDTLSQILQKVCMKIGRHDISVHKVKIRLFWLWGVGSRKRHHNSQDQYSALLNYLEAISHKIVCLGKKQIIEVLMLRQTQDTEKHFCWLQLKKSKWRKTIMQQVSNGYVKLGFKKNFAPGSVLLSLGIAAPSSYLLSFSFPCAQGLLWPCIHWWLL